MYNFKRYFWLISVHSPSLCKL